MRLRVRTTVVQPQDTDARITYVMRLDTRSFQSFNDARRDLVHSARLLRRNLVLTITATLSLAIGIGANTTIFTVANARGFRLGAINAPLNVPLCTPEDLMTFGRQGNLGR